MNIFASSHRFTLLASPSFFADRGKRDVVVSGDLRYRESTLPYYFLNSLSLFLGSSILEMIKYGFSLKRRVLLRLLSASSPTTKLSHFYLASSDIKRVQTLPPLRKCSLSLDLLLGVFLSQTKARHQEPGCDYETLLFLATHSPPFFAFPSPPCPNDSRSRTLYFFPKTEAARCLLPPVASAPFFPFPHLVCGNASSVCPGIETEQQRCAPPDFDVY